MKFEKIQLPNTISTLLKGKSYAVDNVGLSGSAVRVYEDSVLKIQPYSLESRNEYALLQFFSQCDLSPKVIAHEVADGVDFLLMEKCRGVMLCDNQLLGNCSKLMKIASDVLHALWSIDYLSCPVNATLENKLKAAEQNVARGLVDLNNVDPSTFGEHGRFANPEHLLKWLIDNKPSEELAVTHGDFCLPNILFDGRRARVIDVGRGGVADKYQDVALLYRSLRDNLRGDYGGEYFCDLDVEAFFSALGVTPDWDRIDYYILLDELF